MQGQSPNRSPRCPGANRDGARGVNVDRRTFMAGTLSTAVGGAIAWSHGQHRAVAADAAVETGMPGPYPGRVIEVGHAGSVVGGEFRAEPVRAMMARGMTELTGADDGPSAWRSLFSRGDVVGVKVNPVGKPLAISNHVTVHAIVDGLKSAGVRARDIIVFTRYGDQFAEAGYRDYAPDGVQVETAVPKFDSVQLGIKGYDPDVFAHMDFIHETLHDPNDDRARRSHVCTIVTRKINKMVNVPVLKDHGSAGITGALKNLSHGLVNNVSRSHGTARTNTCNVFIPAVCALEPIRFKNVLNIMDGLVGVYQLGPFGAKDSPYTWPCRALFFSTDPVAMDRVEWDIIDAKRADKGLAPVAKTGRMGVNDSGREGFDIRQPQHVLLAGNLGLGVHDPAKITHVKIKLT